MSRQTRETWIKRIAEWKQSGQDAPTFAASVGVTPRTLLWWRWRLGAEKRKRKATSIEVQRAAATPMTFVELATTSEGPPIEIVLRNEMRVRVGHAFDAALLCKVIDVLERR